MGEHGIVEQIARTRAFASELRARAVELERCAAQWEALIDLRSPARDDASVPPAPPPLARPA